MTALHLHLDSSLERREQVRAPFQWDGAGASSDGDASRVPTAVQAFHLQQERVTLPPSPALPGAGQKMYLSKVWPSQIL